MSIEPTDVAEAYAGVILAARQLADWEPGESRFWEDRLGGLKKAVADYRSLVDQLDGVELDVLILRAIAKSDPAAVKLAYDDLQGALISQAPPWPDMDAPEDNVEAEIVQEHQRLLAVQQMAKDVFVTKLAVHFREHGWNLGAAATKYLEAQERSVSFVHNHPQLVEP